MILCDLGEKEGIDLNRPVKEGKTFKQKESTSVFNLDSMSKTFGLDKRVL